MSKGRDWWQAQRHGNGQRRPPRRQGIYRRCWRGIVPCNGTVTVKGVPMKHTPCGGDGWRRVGTAGGGGRRVRGRRRRRPPLAWRARKQKWAKARKRAVRTAGYAGGAAGAGYVLFGTLGLVVVSVLLVLTLGLAVRSRLAGTR